MIDETQFGAPVEYRPGAGLAALATYMPKRLSVATWAVWRDQVIDLAGHMEPDHGVNARNVAAAVCEAVRVSNAKAGTPLQALLSDATILLVLNEAQRRGVKSQALYKLQQRLERAKFVASGYTTPTAPSEESKTAPVGRIAALESLLTSDDAFIRDAAQVVLSDLQVVKAEPWPCPLDATEWKRLTTALRNCGFTDVRWRWSEVKNERIRNEFHARKPVMELLPLMGSASRLDGMVAWTAADVQPVASALRGSANLCVRAWTVGTMPTNSSQPIYGIAPKPTRPNRAAMMRLAAEARAQQAAAPEPRSEKLEAILATWVPRNLSQYEWAQCRDLVHYVMRRATHVTGVESFKKHLRLTADFVNWARIAGYDLDFQALFLERVIEDYVRRGIQHTPRTAADYRSDLRQLAAHINTAPGAPNRPIVISHTAVKPPYTAAEVDKILQLIDLEQDTKFKRRIQVAVALGLGAGLSAQDLRQLSRGHIEDLGADGIIVHVPGDRPRDVWVRYNFEDLLRAGLEGLTRNEHVLGRRNMGKDALVDLYKRIEPLGGGVRLLQGRMRNTWIAQIMCEPISLWTVMQAAGLVGARTLTDIAEYLQPINSLALVRGDAA